MDPGHGAAALEPARHRSRGRRPRSPLPPAALLALSEIEALPGVEDCHQVRMRSSGARLFVDVHVLMDGHRTLWEVYALSDDAERVVQNLVPRADVTVHPEPVTVGAPAVGPS